MGHRLRLDFKHSGNPKSLVLQTVHRCSKKLQAMKLREGQTKVGLNMVKHTTSRDRLQIVQ